MTMKSRWAVKAALGLLPLSLMAGNAFASVTLMGASGGGNGDLLLSLIDAGNGNSYSIDLGTTTLGLEGANNSFSFSQSTATDTALQAFLSAAGTDAINYAVVGGAYDSSGAAATLGSANFLTTAASVPPSIVNSSLAGWTLMDQTFYGGLNVDVASSVNSYFAPPSGPTATGNGNFSDASTATTWYGKSAFQNDSAVGTAQTFYNLVSTYNTAPGTSTQRKVAKAAISTLGSFNLALANGAYTLSYTSAQAAPVPVPAAVWLFGSGLLGLAGVGRRRQTA